LIEEYTLFILIIQFILLSFFLIIFFKKYKNIFNENSIVKPLNDKIDKLNSTADKIFTLKNEIFSERSILQKHLSDLQTSLEKINASMLDINNILNSESSSNFRFASLTRNNTQNKLEKSDFAADVKSNFINKETRIIEEGISNNNNFEINSTHTNNSTNELKALEKEIFTALKRLENTESNSESNKK
jgi:uncharacterized protein YoxC